MSVLWNLNKDGVVSGASDWQTLRSDVESQLAYYGAGSGAEDLVKPLDEAVRSGSDFKALVGELAIEYETVVSARSAQEQAETREKAPEPSSTEAAYEALLPPIEELGTQIVNDLGAEIRELLASDPSLAAVKDEDLIAIIREGVELELADIAEKGWEGSA
jgi:hypothetical protein